MEHSCTKVRSLTHSLSHTHTHTTYTHTHTHNFQSFADYKVGVGVGGKYRVVLDSDAKEFDGHGRIDHNIDYFTKQEEWDGRSNSLMVYIPSRVALVLSKVDSTP